MLPFVVGGGILVAISFFWGIHSADPKDPTYNTFAAALNFIGDGNALKLIVAVLAGFIAMSIATVRDLRRVWSADLWLRRRMPDSWAD